MSAPFPSSNPSAPVARRRSFGAGIAVSGVAFALILALGLTAWSSGLLQRPTPSVPAAASVSPQSAPAQSTTTTTPAAGSAQSWAYAYPTPPTAVAQAPQAIAPAPYVPAPPAPVAPPAPISCFSCGHVASVRQVQIQQRPSGWGAAAGAVGGGVLGSAFGRGNGRAATVILGAVGGGLAGNAIEKRMHTRQEWIVSVRMDNGKWRQSVYRNPPPFGPGQRVRFERSGLVAY